MTTRGVRVPGIVWAVLAAVVWAAAGALAFHVAAASLRASSPAGSLTTGGSADWTWVGLVVGLAVVLGIVALVLRRVPVAAFAVCVTAAVLPTVWPTGLDHLTELAIDPLLAVTGYGLGRRCRPLVAGVIGLAAYAVVATVATRQALAGLREAASQAPLDVTATLVVSEAISSILWLVPWLVLPVVAGMVVHRQVLDAERTLDLVAQERADQAVRVAEAVRSDRERVAHELHDLAAHHTTAVVINARAARKLAGATGDTAPGAARDATPGAVPGVMAELMDSIVDQARDAQSSLRQMVDVLHDPDEATSRRPQPTLAEIPGLVESARRMNPDIVLEDGGAGLRDVAPSVALAAYRIVQESLTNCHRHAPGAPVTVVVEPLDDDALLVEVRNGRRRRPVEPGMGGGRGVDGMRMRAELLGGMLDAGPEGQGWTVHAELPLQPLGDIGLPVAADGPRQVALPRQVETDEGDVAGERA